MRRRILLLVVGMTTLVVLAFAIPLTVLVRNNAYDDGLDALRREANGIAYYLRSSNSTRTPAQIRTYLDGLGDTRRASVATPDGAIIGQLPPGDRADLPAPNRSQGPGPGPGNETPAVAIADGRMAQIFVRSFTGFGGPDNDSDDGNGYAIRVYADDDTLRSGQTGPLLLLGGVAIALIVIGAVAGELLTRRIVRPLVQTSSTAQQLSAGDTTARAPTDGPGEVADVGRALNRLADRIDELIAEERETTADLSHRLRTPMTALRLDAESLRDPAEADRIGTHVSALERMLTAVIHAARRPQREGRMPSTDATSIINDRVEFWSALAEDQGRAVQVDLPQTPLPIRAADEDLAAAVDALLENVIAHTPEGTAFSVRLAAAPNGAVLEISDEGPGLPDDAPVRGRSDRGSSGLGLDIARRCAEASGGTMHLGRSAAGGAMVTLELGSASGPAQ